MLVIRQSQIERMGQAALRRFEGDMVAHLKQFAPSHCEAIGEPAVRKAVTLGTGRARKYGLTNRGPVRFYIELMFMYGSDFDTDPQYLWASRVLNDQGSTDQMTRADRLHEQAMMFTEEIAGRDYVHAKRALRMVHRLELADLPPLDDSFDLKMFESLERIHPEKVSALGEAQTKAVIVYGKSLPDRLSLAPQRGAALAVGAMFALGHGFGHDPLLPWIERTINDGRISDSQARVKRLHARMMTYLGEIIAGFDRADGTVLTNGRE